MVVAWYDLAYGKKTRVGVNLTQDGISIRGGIEVVWGENRGTGGILGIERGMIRAQGNDKGGEGLDGN